MINPSENRIISLGESRQIDALARKALSFQKRQIFTNCCCIFSCPVFIVVIAGVLGRLLTGVIAGTAPAEEYIHCSNANNFNSIGIPYWSTEFVDFPTVSGSMRPPGATNDKVLDANFASIAGARLLRNQVPCVYWMGTDYPKASIYEKDPKVYGKLVRDTSDLPQPSLGWLTRLAVLDPLLVNATTLLMFGKTQIRPWFVVAYNRSQVNATDIGKKEPQPSYSPLAFINLSVSMPPFDSPLNGSIGLLSTIPTRFYTSLSTGEITPVPWYNISLSETSNDLDDFIAASLESVILLIARLDKTALYSAKDIAGKNLFYAKAAEVISVLTYGGVYFRKIDHLKMEYSWEFVIGSDKRFRSVLSFPGAGRRMLNQQVQFDNAILRNSNITYFGNAQITQGFRILPQLDNTRITFNIAGLIGVILFPFGVSFLLPIFSLVLISEKELRILVMMKMNGLKSYMYYMSQYINFYILYAISITCFWFTGMLFQIPLFSVTSPKVLFLFFFLWGHNLVSLAFFFAAFFRRTRNGLIVIFLIVLCSVIISLALLQIFTNAEKAWPRSFFIWPLFAFYRALGAMNQATYTTRTVPYDISRLVPGDEVYTCMVFMIVEIPIYLLLAFYFEQVIPSEFGVPLPWYFPIQSAVKWYNAVAFKRSHGGVDDREERLAAAIQINEAETVFEDEDVKAERKRVCSPDFDEHGSPLIIRNMRKVYAGRVGSGPKLAVKDVSFALESELIFGLLGPNGAGKTTLISILTGLYESSLGDAKIAGFNIRTETRDVHKIIGICPQFDIQWDSLTVGEHLYFYARLKGIKKSDEQFAVKQALAEVSLTAFENRLTMGLSGGEKRRVSIAICLLGNPKVIFLDEPTTGLDPEVRRLIWKIIQSSRKGKTVVLTTHSMEEAEALCQKIGIMAKGTLRCFASPKRLTKLYGSGYKIFVNTVESKTMLAAALIESNLPKGWRKIDSFATQVTYEFPADKGVIKNIFESMEELKKGDFGILDYGLGETSLEEVFVRLISEADATAEY